MNKNTTYFWNFSEDWGMCGIYKRSSKGTEYLCEVEGTALANLVVNALEKGIISESILLEEQGKYGCFIGENPPDYNGIRDLQLKEAIAHLETLANFGGTLSQSKDLAKRGIERLSNIEAGGY